MNSALLILAALAALILTVWLAPYFHKEDGSEKKDKGSTGKGKKRDENREKEGAHEDNSEEDFENDFPKTVKLPLDGSLDLHTFSPKDTGKLVPEWLNLCRNRGFREVRIIHGKGKGVLRRTVHSILDKHNAVESYEIAGQGRGSWGATIVRLRTRHDKSKKN